MVISPLLLEDYINFVLLFQIGILPHWWILWFSCELPCKRWLGLQILGRNCCAVRQIEPSGAIRDPVPYLVFLLDYRFLIRKILLSLILYFLQVASRMVSAFSRWRRYDKTRQDLAKVTFQCTGWCSMILAVSTKH